MSARTDVNLTEAMREVAAELRRRADFASARGVETKDPEVRTRSMAFVVADIAAAMMIEKVLNER
jgi:hypothetical protein